jgi:hypothetical protein
MIQCIGLRAVGSIATATATATAGLYTVLVSVLYHPYPLP